jgi:hypothetical protein
MSAAACMSFEAAVCRKILPSHRVRGRTANENQSHGATDGLFTIEVPSLLCGEKVCGTLVHSPPRFTLPTLEDPGQEERGAKPRHGTLAAVRCKCPRSDRDATANLLTL